MGTLRRQYTDEFNREAVGLLASSGRPLSQIAQELGIAPSRLRAWRNRDEGVQAGSPRRPNTQAAIPPAGDPLVPGHVGALEYRSCAHREIFLALVAAIETVLAFRDPLAKATYRAARSLWPKPTLKVNARRLLVREHLKKLERRNG